MSNLFKELKERKVSLPKWHLLKSSSFTTEELEQVATAVVIEIFTGKACRIVLKTGEIFDIPLRYDAKVSYGNILDLSKAEVQKYVHRTEPDWVCISI